ncbi:MAG: nitrate reductase subunit alpha [Gemmatimonadetes bacterium]|nr:nitrate reductase subunit alpha [Gemmatimonadota bacterium]
MSATGSRWFRVADEPRDWEDFYRSRWSYDRSVRSSHGVNCSGSCSWEVFVKDGLICWELQKTDWPQINSDTPNYEPRGCQRGISASWYPYSPVRPKYPYVRGVLLGMYRGERAAGKDPVEAWASIAEDVERKRVYQAARGKAGWRRVAWEEATELVAAAIIHTIRQYGPDHLASFSPIPAMSMVSFTSGQRLCNLLGGTMLSFYEWYHDLPHIMPMMWGDQTDVAESADWYQSTYWVVIGSNLPMTRTPDCHFASEHKFNGGKIVNLAPNYSDVTKFADLWVPVRPGTDAAFLLACIHVILQEFHVDRQDPYFIDYVKKFTNLPFLVMLEPDGAGGYLQGRFLRASDLPGYEDEQHADWKLLMLDAATGKPRLPGGSLGFRWDSRRPGRWNNELRDAATSESFDPVLTLIDRKDDEVTVAFADFTNTFDVHFGNTPGKGRPARALRRGVPAVRLTLADGTEAIVTTAYDLLVSHMGVRRGLSGDFPSGYDDATTPFTPAWQSTQTGVSAELAIRVGREFADNASRTRGKSMFITGSGVLHWYHGGSLIYRAEAVMGIICGCMGVNGGGFNHYVGTEKIRTFAAIGTLAGAADWTGPARLQNSTSYWYFHTDQWRYDAMLLDPLWAPWARVMPRHRHAADVNALAVRLGWLPFYPQFDKRNPIEVARQAWEDGAHTDEQANEWFARRLKSGELDFALRDVDAPANHPKVMWVYRGNLIGTSMRGHFYALKHLLGTHHNVLGEERSRGLVSEIEWHENAPLGKLDLLVNVNLRMDSSANYADVVLPTAHWYEKYDLTCTDLHSFFHPFTPAHDPPWECRHDWDIFKALAQKVSELARTHLPDPIADMVLTPINTDMPEELAQPLGEVRDWKAGEAQLVPGVTAPKVKIVLRDYTQIHDQYTTLGPRVCRPDGYGAKGIRCSLADVYEQLKESWLIGEKAGRPAMDDARQVAEIILRISPETDGEISHRLFESLEHQTGLSLTHLVEGDREIHHHFDELISQPRRSLTSPHWSAIESPGRTYAPWTMNIETSKPWHTLSGRQEIYFDHRAYRELGESLPTYKPPIDTVALGDVDLDRAGPNAKPLRFLTPHGKWQIHSMFWDTWHMLNLFRGGQVVWLNELDAADIGVKDNDWVEVFNENGISVVRAVVSQTIPRDMCIMYHSSERHINVPYSPLARERGASDLRGGNNNATTRIMMNPSTMIGGYANWSYWLNYWGTSPSERDCVVLVRKMPLETGRKKVLYRERDLR